jgi:hypothetical protein
MAAVWPTYYSYVERSICNLNSKKNCLKNENTMKIQDDDIVFLFFVLLRLASFSVLRLGLGLPSKKRLDYRSVLCAGIPHFHSFARSFVRRSLNKHRSTRNRVW